MDELTLALADGALRIGRTAFTPDTERAARRALLDWFAAALGGSVAPLAARLEATLVEEFAAGGRASCVTDGKRCAARTAALFNGTLAHTVEFDDIYSPALYHPGAPVIAAALAAAQAYTAEAEEPGRLLAAVVAGYEVSNRIGVAINPEHYRFWHTTGTVGTLGAAIAAGVALGLERDALAGALGHAASMAAGLQQAFRSDADTKPLHAGRAAEAGVLAALAARSGLVGAAHMLDGEAGVGVAMSSKTVAWQTCLDGLGEDFTIERMTFKNHGCCGHSFAALDGLIALREGLDLASIESVTISTYQAALNIVGNSAPRTPSEARFSLPYCAATALHDGRVRQAAFSAESMASPVRRALQNLVTLELDRQAEEAFPARRGAVADIQLKDGTTLSRRVDDRKGSPSWPLDDAALRDKLDELGGPAIGQARCRRLADVLLEAELLPPAGELLAMASTGVQHE